MSIQHFVHLLQHHPGKRKQNLGFALHFARKVWVKTIVAIPKLDCGSKSEPELLTP